MSELRGGRGGAREGVFRGSIVAVPTPFKDGAVDLGAVDRLVEFQARARTCAIALGGATGEGWSLSLDETTQLVSRAVEAAAHRSHFSMRVVLCVSEPDSRRAARLAAQAAHAGIDGLFVGAAPYVRGGADGLARHLEEIVGRLPHDLPITLHNEPARTGDDLTADCSERLAREFPQVVAHCEGVGVPGRARRLAQELDLDVLCGDDRMIGPFLRGGAVGALNAVGNLVPAEVRRLIDSIEDARDDADARERSIAPLVDALRAGAHPVPLKEALALLGPIGAEVRPPLGPLGAEALGELRGALEDARMLFPEATAGA